MKFIKGLILFILFLNTSIVYSQSEWIEYISSNYSKNKLKSLSEETSKSKLISLPFFDDFAYPYQSPIENFWIDNNAIVNSSFGENNITIGCATLDAMKATGILNDDASTNAFKADFLTSQPIDLKNYERAYKSDLLYLRNVTYTLLDNSYYMYIPEQLSYVSVIKGLVYNPGDTIYQKVGLNYVPIQDSLFYEDTQFNYIQGSFTYEHNVLEYNVADSLALSFYYQSGGYGDNPESQDSLVLEFYSPFQREGLFINEITKDWIEIYNSSDTTISISNYFIITDTLQELLDNNTLGNYKLSSFSKYTILPYSYTVINASEIDIDEFQSTFIYLFSPDTIVVDSVIENDLVNEEQSYARIPDANPIWSFSVENSKLLPNPQWERIWSTSDTTGENYSYVFIPFQTNKYIGKGFRFRFSNYASLSNDESHARNEDFWNIDMVWLDANRSIQEQNIRDVAFVDKINSLYNKYTAIPIKHINNIQNTDFRMTIESKFTNMDSDFRKVKFNFSVLKKHTDESLNFPTYETDIPAYTLAEERDILTDWNVAFVDFMKADFSNFDEAQYEYQYYFTDNSNPMYSQYRWNDTNRVTLTMNNWYAYDDGIPEAGYGLREAPMGRVAFKYQILQPDTLKAVNIYFNPTMLDYQPLFNLCVWNVNSEGKPGDLLYNMPSEKVNFADGLYTFNTYKIENEGIKTDDINGVFINSDFFIGWEQPYDVLLNVGLDVTSDVQNKLYYNVGFQWEKSAQKGALMMRPIFGNLTSAQASVTDVTAENILIWYAKDSRKIKLQAVNHEESILYSLIDGNGRLLQTNSFSHIAEIDMSNYPNGIYSVRCIQKNKIYSYTCVVAK